MKRSKESKSMRRIAPDEKLSVLPRSQVSEPTKSPFVIWSHKHRLIIDEHDSRKTANSALARLKKDIKKGSYGD